MAFVHELRRTLTLRAARLALAVATLASVAAALSAGVRWGQH